MQHPDVTSVGVSRAVGQKAESAPASSMEGTASVQLAIAN